jgi:hypothetical protein
MFWPLWTDSDKDNAATPRLEPAPTLTIYRDKERPSSISLPILGTSRVADAGTRMPFILVTALTFLVIILTILFALSMRKRLKPQR